MIYIKVCTELKKITAANKSFSSIRGVRAARGARRAMGGASLLPTEERRELGGDALGNSFSFRRHATWEFKYILLKEQSKTASISGLPTDCLHQQMRGEVQLRRFLGLDTDVRGYCPGQRALCQSCRQTQNSRCIDLYVYASSEQGEQNISEHWLKAQAGANESI